MRVSHRKRPKHSPTPKCCPACKFLFLAGSVTILLRIYQVAQGMIEYNEHSNSLFDTFKPLTIHQQSAEGSIMLVHIGKAGGSSLRELLGVAHGYCGGLSAVEWTPSSDSLLPKQRAYVLSALQTHLCALAKFTDKSQTMHLNRNHELQNNFSHFLIPIRNPIHRLVSWYHYERFWMEEAKRRHGKKLEFLVQECGYDTIDKLFLALPSSSTQCQQTAHQCITGEYPCFAHNFFNYEYYLEDILVRRKYHDRHKHNHIRIDVIRAEHSWDDLNRTLQHWTGLPMTVDMDLLYMKRKPFNVDTSMYNKTVSSRAATMACEALCRELTVYRQIVQQADNLPPYEKERSLQELDTTCGFNVGQRCGISFEYRNAKHIKQDRLCEPTIVKQANSTLPPC